MLSLIILHLGLGAAFAKNTCTSVRLDQGNGSMSHVPVRNQGPLGTCYAETAAQVLDAYRFSRGDRNYDHPTSSFMTALYYAEEEGKDWFEGGQICRALTISANLGRCDEVALNKTLGCNSNKQLKLLVRGVVWHHRKYQKYADNIEKLQSESRVRAPAQILARDQMERDRQKKLQETTDEMMTYLIRAGVSRSALPPKNFIGSLLAQKNSILLLKKVLTQNCAKNIQYLDVTPPQCKQDKGYVVGKNGLKQRIDDALEKSNALPVGIAYCSEVLKKGLGYRGLASGGCKKKDDHASLIIGRRPNRTGTDCEYLVRNSWGTSCKQYSKDWDCESGNIWVDQRALFNNLKSVTTVSRFE